MNNETRKTASTPAAASHLTVKEAPRPVMVKKIGKTTYRVKIHFSETSKETVRDGFMADIEKMVSDLIRNCHEVSDKQKKCLPENRKHLMSARTVADRW